MENLIKHDSRISLILLVVLAFALFVSLNVSLSQVSKKKASVGSVLFQPSASGVDLGAVMVIGSTITPNVPHYEQAQKMLPLIID